MSINVHGRDWQTVHKWARAQIADSQDSLERPGLSPERTEYLRGHIRALRALLELPTSLEARPSEPGVPADV